MPDRRGGTRTSWRALGWRVSYARRWVMTELAALIVQAVSRIAWLRWMPRAVLRPFERILIANRGEDLFDGDFYVAHHADVRESARAPLDHYLRYGWREGRAVNPRFDDGHYRAISGLVRSAAVSSLAHYLASGRRMGLCPVPGISLAAHAAAQPGISVARLDPYRHLVGTGAEEDAPGALDASMLMERLLVRRPMETAPEVTVVMPVYLGHVTTLNAIDHVLAADCETAFHLVVIDDATPDGALAADLKRLDALGLLTLLENETNAGFVASINRGSAIAPHLDVIWLNSDTEVYDGWIDRLRRAAMSAPDIATVTPLTNNGTICSYPRTNQDNPGMLELGWRELDRIASETNARMRVESPTAVGFATYVRREALMDVGPLDEHAFGRGYGEENDFSQRALGRGWRNLVAGDVLVRHIGAASFLGTRADRIEAALKVLDRRYPGYHASVARFLRDDPLAAARKTLDLHRLLSLRRDRNVLIISHASGGGTQQHVMEEAQRLRSEGVSVFLMTGGTGGERTARLFHAEAGPLPSLERLPIEGEVLWDLVAQLQIAEVHVHHLLDFGAEGPRIVKNALDRLEIPYVVTIHDYFAVCPRITMSDLSGHYCGEPDVSGCVRCIERRGSRIGRPDLKEWRRINADLLSGARRVRVPDDSVARRICRHVPSLPHPDVIPHETTEALVPRAPGPRRPGPLRVAVIGAIGPTKGFDVLLETASFCQRAGVNAQFSVIGYTRDDVAAREAGIHVTGPYTNDQVDRLIDETDPDLVWIPSIWPETYSYTLSIALRSGRPVAAFAIGALETRLQGVERAVLLPLELSGEPAEIWRALSSAARPRVGEKSLAHSV